jgi:DNA-binding GntR family transcriptional regulator
VTGALELPGLAKRRMTSQAVAESLREAIHAGVLEPGKPLRQAEIARHYEVSTTPVREAFAMLQQEGLVTHHDNRGVVVFKPTVDDLRETYLIRVPLEGLATELAVPALTGEDFAKLRSLLDEMRGCYERGDAAGRAAANRSFHRTIYRAAGLPRLYALIDGLRSSSAAYMRLVGVYEPDFEHAAQEHSAILAACEARAPKRAGKLMVTHLEHTVEVVAAGLERTSAAGALAAS